MNKLSYSRRTNQATANRNGNGYADKNGHSISGVDSDLSVLKSCSTVVQDQARELTSLFVSLTRQLLVMDDFVAEMPLRQLRVCMLLYDGPRSMSALSRELGVSLSAMTQIADRLERARLVKRSFEGSDRRIRSLQLTSRGQKIMRLREEVRVRRALVVVQRMPEMARSEVLASMKSLLDACSDTEDDESLVTHEPEIKQ